MKTFLFLAFFAYSFAAKAQVSLDKSFADSGILIEQNSSVFGDFALQSNGKLIVAGPRGKTQHSFNSFVIARYNKNGSLDTGFGTKGYAGNAGTKAQVFNIAIQKDDAIIAVGRTNQDIKIERFTKDGKLDTSFGNNGAVIFSVGINAYSYASKVILQADGKILISGYTILSNQTKFGFILRYLTNGTLDNSFNNNGVVSWQAPGNGPTFSVTSIAQQQNGQILVNWFYNETDIVNRYNQNGMQDLSFGENGTAHFQTANNIVDQFHPHELIIQADDKIIGSGYAAQSSTGKLFFGAGRLNKNGSIDTGYGVNGLQHIAFTQKVITTASGVLQTDGKLILAGTVKDSKDTYAMTRLTVNGVVDSTFNENGRVVTQLEKSSECQGVLLQSDNKILLGGNTGLSTTNILIARYNNTTNSKEMIAGRKPVNQDILAIKLSPNPAKSNLQISGLPLNQNVEINIIDFSGNIKMQAVANANYYNLNIASLKPGNYLLKLEANNEVVTKQFIKE